MDLGAGTVDKVKISDTVKAGVKSFVYFYDIASKKSVIVTLEGETGEGGGAPVLLESKGPIPLEFENGYVAFEDLPEEHRRIPGIPGGDGFEDDDDDEDEDVADDDKEEEEIIYDGEE